MSPSPQHSHALVATAFHEAGHALAALLLGMPPDRVTIEPSESRFGFITGNNPLAGADHNNYTPAQLIQAEQVLVVRFAGYAAERLVASTEYARFGAQEDFEFVNDFAFVLSQQPSAKRERVNLIEAALRRAQVLVHERKRLLYDLVEALLAERTLERERLLRLLGERSISERAEDWLRITTMADEVLCVWPTRL